VPSADSGSTVLVPVGVLVHNIGADPRDGGNPKAESAGGGAAVLALWYYGTRVLSRSVVGAKAASLVTIRVERYTTSCGGILHYTLQDISIKSPLLPYI